MNEYVGWGWALLVAGSLMAGLAIYRVFHPRPWGDRFQQRLNVAETTFRGVFGCLLILSGVSLLFRLQVSQATMLALETAAGFVLIVIGYGCAVWAQIFTRHVAGETARDGYRGPLRWTMISTATMTFAGLALMSICGGMVIVIAPPTIAMPGPVWVLGAGTASAGIGVLGFGITTLFAYYHR